MIDEMVLSRPIGSSTVMAEQIDRLLTEDRASVHVVPTSTGYYAGLNGPFTIAEVDGSEVAVLDALLQGRVVDSPEHLSDVRQIWEDVRSEAQPRGKSREILEEAYERWKS